VPPAPPGMQGYAQPSGYRMAGAAGPSLMTQFRGMAGWSIILGVVSVGVPIVTGLTTGGSVVYFYVLPIFGLIRGVQAIMRGQVLGGIVGIVLNILGGLISLAVALVH
jgi:hypothetical protein